ncbi:hypothetical protein D3C87_2027880 [compost metagenome]
MPTSITDMIHWARAVTCTPKYTHAAMITNQMAPTPVMSGTLSACDGSNSETVIAPAGRAPATMKIVAEITSAHPDRKPSAGWSARATHE